MYVIERRNLHQTGLSFSGVLPSCEHHANIMRTSNEHRNKEFQVCKGIHYALSMCIRRHDALQAHTAKPTFLFSNRLGPPGTAALRRAHGERLAHHEIHNGDNHHDSNDRQHDGERNTAAPARGARSWAASAGRASIPRSSGGWPCASTCSRRCRTARTTGRERVEQYCSIGATPACAGIPARPRVIAAQLPPCRIIVSAGHIIEGLRLAELAVEQRTEKANALAEALVDPRDER